MKETKGLDPVTVEVIKNSLVSAANEMTSVLVRTSFNPILYEMVDFCVDLFNEKAELIAEGRGAVCFMGTVSFGIRNVVNHVGKDNIEEGDVFVTIYSYFAGSHHPDVLVFKPIFHEKQIFGYAAAKAHWLDVGACSPFGCDSTDMWQEGVIIPGAKLAKRGVLDKEILDIIRFNSRLGDSSIGDVTASMAACEAGEKRLLALINKYGKDTVSEAIAAIMNHDETIMRQAIAKTPDGEYHAEGQLDNNGLDDNPLKVHVTVRVKGDEMTIDTTGSAPQALGPTNCPYPSTVAFCRLVMKMIFDPYTRASEGHWRPLSVIAPEGTIYNPQPPAPTYLYGWTAEPLGEGIFAALAEAVPEKVVAHSGGDICAGAALYGINPRDGKWFMAIPGQGPIGQGASFDRDGGDATINYAMSGSEAIPIEVCEERYPMLIENWVLRQDSGGPGKFRGGLGIERYVKGLINGTVDGVVEQTKDPPRGLFGGKRGLPNVGILWPGTSKEKKFGKFTKLPFLVGERHCVLTGGGGGWGNPYERDIKTVLEDVVRGYVSLDSARKDYGVIIREENGEHILDEAETEKLRKQKLHGV